MVFNKEKHMSASPLIDCNELLGLLEDPRLVLLDVRADLRDHTMGRRLYEEGHIRAARFCDMEADVSGARTGANGRHPLPDSGRFCANMRRLGLNPDSICVVYDGGACNFAARLWFTLRWVGFENVRVLNGGWRAWREASLTVTRESPDVTVGTWRAAPPLERVWDVREIERNLETEDYLLVDARSADRFAGQNETLDPKGGHIPGSINRPCGDNLTEQGLFKAADLLAREFENLLEGRDPASVINSCGSGVTACCNHLAMTAAGLPSAGVYIGSWSEWSANPDHPTEP